MILTIIVIVYLGYLGFNLIFQTIFHEVNALVNSSEPLLTTQGDKPHSPILNLLTGLLLLFVCVVGLIGAIDHPNLSVFLKGEVERENERARETLTDHEFMALAECLNDWSMRVSQTKWLELLKEKYGSSADQMMQTVQGMELEREADRLVKENIKKQGNLMISLVANLSAGEKSAFFKKLENSPGKTMDWLIQQIITKDNGEHHEKT